MTNEAQVPANGPEVTDDVFLGDGLRIFQPARGYRAGIDAVLLAASVKRDRGDVRILDAGAGAGVVGLAVARRFPRARVVLLERESDLLDLARRNVERNELGARARVVAGDLTSLDAGDLAAAGLAESSFDCALANPPYHEQGRGTPSSSPLKAAAHAMEPGGLDRWVRFLARMVRPGGSATVIHRAEALGELLLSFGSRFGGLQVLPIHARSGEPAIRVIIRGTKGSRAPLSLLPGFILHGPDGAFTGEAEAILRHGASLLPLAE